MSGRGQGGLARRPAKTAGPAADACGRPPNTCGRGLQKQKRHAGLPDRSSGRRTRTQRGAHQRRRVDVIREHAVGQLTADAPHHRCLVDDRAPRGCAVSKCSSHYANHHTHIGDHLSGARY
eukprot:gene14912-biopygen3628